MFPISRRRLLATGIPWSIALAAGLGSNMSFADGVGLSFGPEKPFSFEGLIKRADELAKTSYPPENRPAADVVKSINFDVTQKIKYRPDYSLWRNGPGTHPIRFFHLTEFSVLPVKIHAVARNTAREIFYSSNYFDYGATGLDKRLPGNLGFSGFRVLDGRTTETDWLAFQGASYFRSSGERGQYGASARGIALNTALSTTEEFPRFTEFWLVEPAPRSRTVLIYALLEGPSVTGAYRFGCTRQGAVVMDVRAEIFVRADVQRLGIAPLTSMYWYGENERRRSVDWRPEIHDSDGLSIWTGKGERIWRPIVNPPQVQTNSFIDVNPKGFGLMQRDHRFDSYQDDGAFYEKRPSIWVEPRGDWGEGAVQLVEIPTDAEIYDNIVAYWQPKAPVKSGARLTYDYRLYWQDDEPGPPAATARVVATRIGRGGIPGQMPPPKNAWKFAIDFEGGPLSAMEARFDVKPVVTASRGKIDNAYVVKVVGTDRWRALFDVTAEGNAPISLRGFLRLNDETLSETWLYQFFPAV